MQTRISRAIVLSAALGIAALTATGCAVTRDQQTVGAYIDDAGITTQIKARLVESDNTSAGAINVETLNGEVQLSGFAQSEAEKAHAGQIAASVNNVKRVTNSIVVRP